MGVGLGVPVATPPKHLNFEINLMFTFSYALPGENYSRKLPEIGVGGLTLVDFFSFVN